METPNNLLVKLHKWAVRQDENFLTESFAHLLQHLLDHEPVAAVQLAARLTGGLIQLPPEHARQLELRTQVVADEGRPDLELRTADQLAVVEVKSESPPNADQLSRYQQRLRLSGMKATTLVLLTRYPAVLEEGAAQPDLFLRWYQVADWIDQESKRYTFQAVSKYLADQFLGFLHVRNMIMGQVTWELPGGIRALCTLTDMLYEAASACGLQAQIWGSREYMGVNLEGRRFWWGVSYSRPELLTFSTNYARVDKDAADRLGSGTTYEWGSEPGFGWRRELSLDSEDVHFFARSKASQLQFLETFLRECLDLVGKVMVAAPETDAAAADDEEPE